MAKAYMQYGKEYSVKLPKSKEKRVVVVSRGFLFTMKDTETGIKGFGYTTQQCLESLEDLLKAN